MLHEIFFRNQFLSPCYAIPTFLIISLKESEEFCFEQKDELLNVASTNLKCLLLSFQKIHEETDEQHWGK